MVRRGRGNGRGITRGFPAINDDVRMYSSEIDYKAIGQKLRKEREDIGWTQEDVAEVLDISPAFCGHLERGERSMSLDTLIRFCNFYRITIDYLLSDTLPPEQDNVTKQITSMLKTKTAEQQAAVLDILRAMIRHI